MLVSQYHNTSLMLGNGLLNRVNPAMDLVNLCLWRLQQVTG